MAPTSIILVILSALIHVGWNYLTKSSSSPKLFSLLKGSLLILLVPPLLPIIPLSSIPTDVWALIVLSGLIHAIYIFALASAYEVGDMSFVYPIARSAPAFVPIAAFFIIGECISPKGAAGIAIVVTGVFLMQFRGTDHSEFRRLISSLKQKDSLWAFITLAAVVSYTITDKAGMVAFSRISEITNGTHGPIFFLLENFLCYLLFGFYIFCRGGLTVKTVWKKEWAHGILAAIGTLTSYSLILHVMQTETVSYIVALRQSSILFAILTGWKALKEPFGRYRLLVACFMLFGFFLVATA
jgi:drug/metabolite transporter (DMT)-like permease